MNIQIIHNVGDVFWKMAENKPREYNVHDIYIHIDSAGTPEIRYEYNEPRGRVQVTNDTFFPTKADLLASL